MADAAKALGHSYLALTDHSPRLTVAHGLDATRLRQQLDVVGHLNELLAPFRILTGIEVDILEDGSLDQDDDLLERLDVVVASVHSKLRMERRVMTARLLRAVQNPTRTSWATAPGDFSRGEADRLRTSTHRPSSLRAPIRPRPSRSTHAPSDRTRPMTSSTTHSRPDACSPSTPTRMLLASSSGHNWDVPEPQRPA